MSDVPHELACPLCLDLLHEPVSTDCVHTFCRACIARVLASGHASCPLCRREIRNFDPATAILNADIIGRISAAIPTEEVARRAREALDRLEFVVGNLYEEVHDGRPARSGNGLRNTNKWTMYVTLCGAASQHTSKFIDKVVYGLHPTFKPSTVTAFGPTFSISRKGWGTFPVECVVHWTSQLNLPPTKIDHWLEFEAGGSRTSGSVDISSDARDFISRMLNNERAVGPAPGGYSPPTRDAALSGRRRTARARSTPPLRDAGQLEALEVVVGNRCVPRNDDAGTDGSRTKYRWTMYVQLLSHTERGVPLTGQGMTMPTWRMDSMIESVIYELHATFRERIVTCTSAPFEMSRIGWGTFPVKCTINWKPRLRIPPTEVVHQLVFDNPGANRTATTVGVPQSVLRSI